MHRHQGKDHGAHLGSGCDSVTLGDFFGGCSEFRWQFLWPLNFFKIMGVFLVDLAVCCQTFHGNVDGENTKLSSMGWKMMEGLQP